MFIKLSFEALQSICKAECMGECLLVDKSCDETNCPIIKDYEDMMREFEYLPEAN